MNNIGDILNDYIFDIFALNFYKNIVQISGSLSIIDDNNINLLVNSINNEIRF